MGSWPCQGDDQATVRRINWTPTHLARINLLRVFLKMFAQVSIRLSSNVLLESTVRGWESNGKHYQFKLCVCQNVCGCVCMSLCSHVMYVRLAASRQFQVGLITKVIPPEQQLRNGRR